MVNQKGCLILFGCLSGTILHILCNRSTKDTTKVDLVHQPGAWHLVSGLFNKYMEAKLVYQLRLIKMQAPVRHWSLTMQDSPWISFWAMLCVRMRDDRRRTSPLNTHSCTGKSGPVRRRGFLLLSSMTSDVCRLLVLALLCACWLCCCCVDGDLISLWLLKILLALLLLLVLGAVNVPVAASSSGSSKPPSLLGPWSLRRVRIFSPVIFQNQFKLREQRASSLTMTLRVN